MQNVVIERRYDTVTAEKAGGVTYTPRPLADFVASHIIANYPRLNEATSLRVLDPAVGSGELLISLVEQLRAKTDCPIYVYGFETDEAALMIAIARLEEKFSNIIIEIRHENFLDFVVENYANGATDDLFQTHAGRQFDLIIANPPYVRTQIMGGKQAGVLAEQFNLTGRVDLYHAFILGMTRVLAPDGMAGIIVSNRFMTTRSGAAVRKALREKVGIKHIWDLGDTKLFDVAVLPAVVLFSGQPETGDPIFSTIYKTEDNEDGAALTPLDALSQHGVIRVADGRCFHVQHGNLDTSNDSESIWRISSEAVDEWMATVDAHTHTRFADIGKIRVGVKTCADKVFIRTDWSALYPSEPPELLRPLITHHVSRRYKANISDKEWQILYPHETVNGKRRPVNLKDFPQSIAYLEQHRETLEARKYVIEAGRNWYELWVPQEPSAWDAPKLVFRDISEDPIFWIDDSGAVVNGDCYWLIAKNKRDSDLLWLAAGVGNSSFIEAFYDHRFNNKLYAGRRRFITQYVKEFPLPDPTTKTAKRIIALAKEIHTLLPAADTGNLEQEIDKLVWSAFGLPVKEIAG